MDNEIAKLNPPAVWRHFAAISEIPRCSRHEEAVRQYVVDQAERLGLTYRIDGVGNIIVNRPGGPGSPRTAPVVLQGHLDMVCEKNASTDHDFSRDAIRLVQEGDWIRADDTTLGADNGIAVAMMLAILESEDDSIGPVQCLFTIDEETGLTGALELDPTLIEGRRLINLDTEEEGFFCIGCAGGKNTYGEIPLVFSDGPGISGGAGNSEGSRDIGGARAYRLELTGLSGGHSGAEIHLELGNSIVLGARLLDEIRRAAPSMRVSDLQGGNKHNAIPREFTAVVSVAEGEADRIGTTVSAFEETARAELGTRDPGLSISVSETGAAPTLGADDSGRIVDLLLAIPHGVLGMSAEVPGLVETSTNLAAIHTEGNTLKILTSQRSSRPSMITAAAERVAATIRLGGGSVRFGEGYPAWPPRPESPLVDTAVEVFTRRFGREPEVGAFHAGLECGVIGDKVGEMDMISFGPDMSGVHTPDERISISSTERTWELLLDILRALGD